MSASTSLALADDEVIVNSNRGGSLSVNFSEVRPFRNPLAPPPTNDIKAEAPSALLASGAMPPSIRALEAARRAYGSFAIPNTSTRVATGGSNSTSDNPNYLATTYPYRAIGKLTFSAGYCSASLIRRSVLVTAAHCIQRFGTGTALYSNFQFTPAQYSPGTTPSQVAPYGTWAWAALVRPASWASGTDIGSGSARDNDLAVIAVARNASGQFIGDITGWLSYGWNNYSFVSSSKTGNLAVAAVSTLGYPGLLDAGGRMQLTDGPTYLTTVGGAGQLWQGSNFTGGASGGPWIVNFRSADAALSGGAVLGTAATMSVVGVTSWGTSDPNAPKDNYSSQFRQNSRYPAASYGVYGAGNIASLLNTLCSTTAGGGQTYAQAGYCN
jgi:hypothetical protein